MYTNPKKGYYDFGPAYDLFRKRLQAHIKVVSLYRAFHSVILFCSNSIKLIVFLGNYPQPPAGQISIHDLNNAY